MTRNKKADCWKKLGMDLAGIVNGAPTYIYQIPVRDPGGQVVGWEDGKQCLLCYKGVRGKRPRHHKDCVWLRARALRRLEKRRTK